MNPEQELIDAVKDKARQLAEALKTAQDAGVSPLVLIPALMDVARETGLMPEDGIPGLPFAF